MIRIAVLTDHVPLQCVIERSEHVYQVRSRSYKEMFRYSKEVFLEDLTRKERHLKD